MGQVIGISIPQALRSPYLGVASGHLPNEKGLPWDEPQAAKSNHYPTFKVDPPCTNGKGLEL